MLTLLTFMCFVWVVCIFVLANRYESRPITTTLVALIVTVLVATVVGVEEQYETLAYLVSANVTLLSSILVVYCFGNNEKHNWTQNVERNVINIFDALERNQNELAKLSKRIK